MILNERGLKLVFVITVSNVMRAEEDNSLSLVTWWNTSGFLMNSSKKTWKSITVLNCGRNIVCVDYELITIFVTSVLFISSLITFHVRQILRWSSKNILELFKCVCTYLLCESLLQNTSLGASPVQGFDFDIFQQCWVWPTAPSLLSVRCTSSGPRRRSRFSLRRCESGDL